MLAALRAIPRRGALSAFVAAFAVATLSALLMGYSEAAVLQPYNVASVNGALVVYQGSSSLVFTGVMPREVVEYLENGLRSSVVSPEVLALVYVGKRLAVARGVTSAFFETVRVEVVEGSLELTPFCALLGSSLSRELGSSPGEVIGVVSAFNGRTTYLKVCGIFAGGGPLDDELLVDAGVARFLRGLGEGQASIVRVLVGSSEDERLLEALQPARGAGGTISAPLWLLEQLARYNVTTTARGIAVRGLEDLAALGRAALAASAAASLLLSAASLLPIAASHAESMKPLIDIMKVSGVGRRAAELFVALAASAPVALGLLGALAVAGPLARLARPRLLLHAVPFELDPLASCLYAALVVLAAALVSARIAARCYDEA
ncbi:MAG: hypothetical protein ABWK00_03020 [Desulfurococcaceae archaeon]